MLVCSGRGGEVNTCGGAMVVMSPVDETLNAVKMALLLHARRYGFEH